MFLYFVQSNLFLNTAFCICYPNYQSAVIVDRLKRFPLLSMWLLEEREQPEIRGQRALENKKA